MYKTRLQEMCHQRMWAAPDYTVTRDGPDHDPRFRASVAVNGVSFHAPDPSKSSKEAQNKVAQVAVDHLAVNLPPKPSPQPPAVGSNIPYKSQLQTYAQRNCVDLPKYDVVREVCAHAFRFMASVTVNGQTFRSLQYFNTLKEAENDAARVAVSSLPLDENTRDEPNFYKNLLQELAHKEGISLPKYNTVSNGARHMPIFSSTVEIGGDTFVGDAANTRKQAEMNAAKVAWCKLKERSNTNLGKTSLSLVCSGNELLEPASSGSQSKDSKNFELPNPLLLLPSHVDMKYNGDSSAKKQEGGITGKNGSSTVMASIFTDYQGAHLTNITNGDGNEHTEQMTSHNKLVSEVPEKKENTPQVAFFQDGTSTPSSKSDCSSIDNVIAESPVARTSSALLCNRVRVYPRKPDMVLPAGAIMLPFSDDTWFAVSLDFPNHEGSQTKAIQNLEPPSSFSVPPPYAVMKQSGENSVEKQEDVLIVENGPSAVAMATIHQEGHDAHLREETMIDDKEQHTTKMTACQNKEDNVEDTVSLVGTLGSSSPLDRPDVLLTGVISDSPMGVTHSTLLCKRVGVYPRKPDMHLPQGATLLPFSDDMWVAVSLDFSNHEDVYRNDGTAISVNGNDDFNRSESSFHKLDTEVIEKAFFVDNTSLSPMGGVTCSLHCNRVRVYPRKPDMVLPEGALQLPFSDDKWIAVSLNF